MALITNFLLLANQLFPLFECSVFKSPLYLTYHPKFGLFVWISDKIQNPNYAAVTRLIEILATINPYYSSKWLVLTCAILLWTESSSFRNSVHKSAMRQKGIRNWFPFEYSLPMVIKDWKRYLHCSLLATTTIANFIPKVSIPR